MNKYSVQWLSLFGHRYCFLLISGVCLCASVFGQNAPVKPAVTKDSTFVKDSVFIDFNREITTQLVPFEELLALALVHSPLLKYEVAISDAQKASYKLTKMQLLRSVNGLATYSTGNQAIISTVSGSPVDAIGQIANGYRIGANFQISLYDLVSRKQQNKQAYANQEAAMQRQEVIGLQVKREMIDLYQDLITSQRLLKLHIQDEQVAVAAFQIAEMEFKQRKIDANIFTGISKNYYGIKAAIEEARGTFLKYLFNLEAVVGVPLQSLKRK